MLHFDTSDLAQPRLLYTQAGYVPARQCATECGLNVGRWWIETEQTHEDRPVYTAELSAWTSEQRAAIAEAHELARRHAQKSRVAPSTDDIGWFEEQWLLAHPIEPSLDNTPEQLMALARQAFLQAPAPVAPAPRAAPATRAAPAAAAGATTAAASAAASASAAAAAAAGAGEAAYGAPVGPPPVVSVAPQQPDELPSAEPFDPNKPAKKGRGKSGKAPILLAAPPTPEPPAPMAPEPPAPPLAPPAPPAPPAPVAAPAAPAVKAPKAAAPKAGVPLKASLGELLAAHAPAVTPAPTPAPAPVAPAAPAPAPKKRLVSAKPSAATTPVGSEPETQSAAKAAPEQPRTPELDRARAGLLTVLSRGARVPGARLLLQLRARGGATAIYSASERRFVALGYVG